jgi:hypothetical protein
MSKKIIAVFVVTGVATQQALAYVDDPSADDRHSVDGDFHDHV